MIVCHMECTGHEGSIQIMPLDERGGFLGLQGLMGYCSMPGMTAAAVAWRIQPSGVPGGVNWFPGSECMAGSSGWKGGGKGEPRRG